MSRSALVDIVRNDIEYAKQDRVAQTEDVFRVPAEHYYDPERFTREVDRLFRRVPLMLALSTELAKPGAYKAMDAAGVPVLMTRDSDGTLRAFVNMCSHRGSQLVLEGSGDTRRFVCPYHGWAYDRKGDLVGVFAEGDFGEIDRACHGLVPLPVAERAGLVWVSVDPKSTLDIETFLCGYDEMLAHFDFGSWHLVARQEVAGPNWKIAYDGYLDLYHLPILHRETFGPNMPHRAHYYAWGPHQRVSSPHPALAGLGEMPDADWPDELLMNGVWTVFPHVSIASFDAGGRGVLVSQLFPGAEVGSSRTIQSYLMEQEPDAEGRAAAEKQMELLEYVVREEDYATGLRQQQALRTGARSHVLFGRNEGGGRCFHDWVDRILECEDAKLQHLFASAEKAA